MAPVNCKKCAQIVKANGYSILCTSCQGWLHRDCANLTVDEIKIIAEKIKNGRLMWKCQQCAEAYVDNSIKSNLHKNAPDNSLMESASGTDNIESLKNEIDLLNKIISEKDEKFKLMVENKTLLEEKVHNLILQNEELRLKITLSNNSESVTLDQKRVNNSISPLNKLTGKRKIKNTKNTKNAKPSTATKVISDPPGPSNTNNNPSTHSANLIKIVNGDSMATHVSTLLQSQHIIGSGDSSSNLSAAKAIKWYFITRINHSVDDTCVKHHIENKLLINEALVTRIIPRKFRNVESTYASFKIGVPEEFSSVIMSTSSWPTGILIKEFETRQQQRHQRHKNIKINYSKHSNLNDANNQNSSFLGTIQSQQVSGV